MPKSNDSINRELFDLLSTRGYRPTMLDTSGKEIPVPEEAEVFQFNFVKDDVDYGVVTISIDGLHKLVIYFNDKIADSEKETSDTDDVSWYRLLNHLKRFAKNRQLSFQVKNTDHLKHDMAKRDHMKKLDEGYYPMGKNKSYSDAVPQVKIVIEHTRNIVEGEQRYRNVARIFVENTDGERFLLPTTKPGIARVYARHIAEGGTPYDDRANHITSLVEEYNKMAGFVRATRNGQFNESAQRLVLEGANHYTKLRETLSRMAGSRGYNTYFESWTPSLMEDEIEEANLNELFVQETLDPRIESVMPILSKLQKNLGEMKEVNALAEWADSLLEGGDGGEASEEPPESKEGETAEDGNESPEDDLSEAAGAETLAHNDETEEGNLKAFDLDEGILDTVKKVGGKVLDKLGHSSDEDLLKDLKKRAGVRNPETGKPSMAQSDVEKRVDEVDMGQYDARKSTTKGETTPEQEKSFREKVKQYSKELEQRQNKKQGMTESNSWDRLSGDTSNVDPEHLEYLQKQAEISRRTGLAVGDRVTLKNRPGFEGEIVHDWGGGDYTISGEGGGMKQSNNHRANARIIQKIQGMAEGGAKDRQWSNKDMERLRVATRDFDDIMASDGPDQTKQDLIKKRIQTKPMAGPRGVLPEQGVAEAATPASVSKVLRLIQRHKPEWFDNYGIGEVEDVVVDMAEMGQFRGTSDRVAMALVGQELESMYGQQGMAEGEFAGDYATGEAGQWRNKGPKAHKPATIGDLVGEGQEDLNAIKRLLGK